MMNNTIDYFIPQTEDTQGIVECRIVAQGANYNSEDSFTKTEVDLVAGEIEKHPEIYLVAKSCHKVIGYIKLITRDLSQSLSYYGFDSNYDLELSRLFILPKYQRQGVGKKLLQ